MDQDVSLLLLSEGHLHRVQDLKGLVLGSFKAFGNNPGVEPLANVELSLLQELSNQEDGRGGSVSSYIILQKDNYVKIGKYSNYLNTGSLNNNHSNSGHQSPFI